MPSTESNRAPCSANVRRIPQFVADLLHVVADDGVGGAAPGGGAGLRGVADRVDALGGHLRVHSPTGGGTRVEVEFPY